MDAYFGAATKRAWDGGFFGLISWAEIMLLGTLAFDMVSGKAVAQSVRRLLFLGNAAHVCWLWGIVFDAVVRHCSWK